MSSLGIYATATVIATSSSAATPVVPLLAKKAAWVLILIVIVCVLVETLVLMVATGVIIPSALARIRRLTMSNINSALLRQMRSSSPVWKTAV